MKRLDDAAKEALSRAVEAVEGVSSAEVVIAVRPESSPPHQLYALAPPAFALLGLVFLVESPWPFSNLALWLDTCFFAIAGFGLCKWLPGFGRLFILPGARERGVAQAAYREWVERGVVETRERTGVLVYVSQRERAAKVLFDRGVSQRVPAEALAQAAARVESAAAAPSDGEQLARAIEALGPLLGRYLPRAHDDVNELADGVRES